jgi:hypothetical protein
LSSRVLVSQSPRINFTDEAGEFIEIEKCEVEKLSPQSFGGESQERVLRNDMI